jgi:hypothetical protein
MILYQITNFNNKLNILKKLVQLISIELVTYWLLQIWIIQMMLGLFGVLMNSIALNYAKN